jgi:hypothetical protein
LKWLKEHTGDSEPCIERADESLALEVSGEPGFLVEETREHFDYVYLTRDLIDLAGGAYRPSEPYHQFHRAVASYTYEELEERHAEECLALQERWCLLRRCEEDLNLQGEWEATREILINHRSLGVSGAVIVIDSAVKGFTLGELLGDDMAVIHIEKPILTSPPLSAHQSAVLRQTVERCEVCQSGTGPRDTGLRDAKLSYGPDHLVKKYRITLKG